MKATLFAAALMITGLASANTSRPYWVIESNVNKTNFTKVRIYDAESKLIYEELVIGRSLNIEKKKDRKMLDRKLKEVLKLQGSPLCATKD